jgi:hypothetical protein
MGKAYGVTVLSFSRQRQNPCTRARPAPVASLADDLIVPGTLSRYPGPAELVFHYRRPELFQLRRHNIREAYPQLNLFNTYNHPATMLKYFTPKKGKEQHENHAEQHLKDALAKDDAAKGKGKEKERSDEPPSPVLSDEDEHFLEHLVSDEGPAPPLPPRPFLTPQISMESMASSAKSDALPGQDVAVTDKGKGKENEKDKTKKNRFSFLSRNRKSDDKLKPNALAVPPQEADKEKDDISKVLEELNLSAVNNRAFSLSKESQVLVQKFTLVLKDLVNGVPTAYDDLVALIDNANDTLSKNYDHLPSYLKKLIKTLPSKLTGNMAPELLAVAAEAQGLGAAAATGGFSAAAKSMLTPSTLKNLVTKPGAVAGMLRAVMNALKLRWPAFMGTNVLFSLGLFGKLFYISAR